MSIESFSVRSLIVALVYRSCDRVLYVLTITILSCAARTFGNDLEGTLPSEIMALPKLESLIMQNNRLQGTIPDFLAEISNLETLILSGNPMEGTIPSIILQNAPLLGTLHLSRMKLTGTIPIDFAPLPINDLRLDENALTGPIPAALGSASSLRKFYEHAVAA